jgi:hypothetical protein
MAHPEASSPQQNYQAQAAKQQAQDDRPERMIGFGNRLARF